MAKFFINRPIVAMVISILLVIVGAVSIAGLPVAQFPAIAPPSLTLRISRRLVRSLIGLRLAR